MNKIAQLILQTALSNSREVGEHVGSWDTTSGQAAKTKTMKQKVEQKKYKVTKQLI